MPPGAIPLVRTGALLPFVRFLDEIGAPCERLLETARLSPHIVQRPDAVFPLHQGLRFVDHAAHSQGVENLGMLVGQQTRILDLADLGRLLSPAMTLEAALALFVKVISLFSSGERLALGSRGDKAVFSHAFDFGEAAGRRHGDLFTLMLMIDLIRLAAGPGWRPPAVWLCVSEASRRKFYENMLGTAVFFAANCWAIVFDRSLLDERLRYCRPSALLAADPVEVLRGAAPAADFVGSLRQVIASLLPHGNPRIGVVAEVANLSTRTLQRRLTAENRTYSGLLEEARLQAAMRLLRQNETKLVDVALELGYSDAANFTRAFRRWSGVPPRTARRQGTE